VRLTRLKMVTVTIFLLTALPAWAEVTVENAWARATPPGARLAAGYMTLRNSGEADRLVSVRSPAAEKVQTHVTIKDGDVSRMRETRGYDVPAKGALELSPGGSHLMLVNIKAPLKEGDKVPLVLRFEKAGEVKTELAVRPLGAATHDHMHH
jgi:copper(I)-binding protein